MKSSIRALLTAALIATPLMVIQGQPVAFDRSQAKVAFLAPPSDDGPMPVVLRFQLITPTDNTSPPVKEDPAIAEVSAALKSLFRYAGYQLLDQAAISADFTYNPNEHKIVATEQRLVGNGINYTLHVVIDSATATGLRMLVNLVQENTVYDTGVGNLANSGSRPIFSTQVVVSFDHTVVLGSTHPFAVPAAQGKGVGGRVEAPSASGALPLILVVRPEIRKN